MSGILSSLGGQSTGQPTKCADVVFDPDSGDTPLTVSLSTLTAGAHIFIRRGGNNPQHTGDSAIYPTVRIGSNAGSFDTGAGTATYKALAYEPSHLDSNITQGTYSISGGGG